MSFQTELDAELARLQRLNANVRRRPCGAFADILWSPVPDLLVLMKDPGVLFESRRRVVVFQRIEGELRYYAGGACPDENQIYLEQDRIAAEGCELGILGSVQDALVFAEQYLVDERGLSAVEVSRKIRYSYYPEIEGADEGNG
jgi:hypothetical protein